jgi:3-keto-5-aminohexanoate cleavage enzyme
MTTDVLEGKVMIEVRCNEYTMKDRNPNVPWSAAEIGEDAARCRDAGAAVVHYHARNAATGAAAWDVVDYAEVIKEIRSSCDVLIHPTLGASTIPDPEIRVAHIPELAADPTTRPDIAPVDLGSFNIDPYDWATKTFRTEDLVYHTSIRGLRHEIERIQGAGVAVQAVLWTVGSARLLGAFMDMGVLPEPALAEITLSDGWLSTHPGTVRGLQAMVDFLPSRRVVWSVGLFGGNLLKLVHPIVEMGGHISIGLGDYPYLELGTPSNADVVAEVVRMCRSVGREPATPDDVRAALHLS